MKNCTLDVVLESETARFRPGETIRGVVRVDNAEQRGCRLSVMPRWRTSSNVDRGYSEGAWLFLGDLPAGSTEYPFSIRAPSGPLSYRGKVVSVGWAVVACAEFQGGDNRFAERELVLERWLPGDELPASGLYRERPLARPSDYVYGCCRLPGARTPYYLEEESGPFESKRLTRKAWGWARIGSIRVDAPREVAAGDRIDVHVRTKRHVALDSVEIWVQARELSYTDMPVAAQLMGYGSTWSLQSEVVQAAVVDGMPVSSGNGAAQEYVGSLALPLNAPPTFSGVHDALDWSISVTCCRGAAKVTRNVPVAVRPPRV